jgi:glycosyltransferase involved in cell wall biosynthesis
MLEALHQSTSRSTTDVLAQRGAVELRVSVCMAVHNGAAFLKPQIESILVQLGPQDELWVVDDHSKDASQDILRTIADPRLHVHRNERNIGVLRTFEKALTLASGDILFLSDQDDVWLAGKVDKVLNTFALDPAVTMVATDARLIDEQGRTIKESFFSARGRFTTGFLHNFVKNKYLGCTLSFRQTMLQTFLPIPLDVPMHDIWFGLLNEIYGKTHFISEPLIAYRRHRSNASPLLHAGLIQMLLWRTRLAKNIVRRVVSRGFPTHFRRHTA